MTHIGPEPYSVENRLRIDSHQHLWPEPLVAELSRRREPPSIRRDDRGWFVSLRGEPDSAVDLADHDPDLRGQWVEADGLDRALIAISSPLGIEALPADEATPLLEAYHDGVASLDERFAAWGAVALAELDPRQADALLGRGFVGLSIPAGAIASPAGLERCGPLLERLERLDAPLLVHPGPAPWNPAPDTERGVPDWWPAMSGYVAQMNSAWHAFLAAGRPAHPRLRVLFAMLAGGGPLHAERLAVRGGPGLSVDNGLWVDSSSYGVQMLDHAVRVLGVEQLVYGSDRPVLGSLDCPLGEAVRHAMLVTNPSRLLQHKEVLA